MMVCTLGYVDFAEQYGGYPTGYQKEANDLKLTDGIKNQSYTEPAKRQVIAQLVYNALEVAKMEKDSKGVWATTSKNILNNYLGVYKLKGTLVGVEDTKTKDCESTLLDYQMAVQDLSGTETIIDVRNFTDLSVVGLQNYVGNEVTVYYSQPRSNDDKSLVILDTETVKNSVYEITYDNIVNYNGSSLEYYESAEASRSKSMKVDASKVTVVYNDQTLSADEEYTLVNRDDSTDTKEVDGAVGVLKEILSPTSSYFIYGDVTLTDSGSDGNVEMVSVNDYRWMIAHKTVSSTDYTVQNTLVTTDTLVVDPDDIDKKVYVEKNGKEITPTQIATGDVLTYTKSFDESVIRVYITNETVTGTVNSIGTDKITIENKEYNLDERCIEFIKSKTSKTLSNGNNVTMKLDKLGTVIYGTVKEEAVIPYAYITDVFEESSEDALYLTAFAPSVSTSTAKTLKIARPVKLNGSSVKSYTEVMDLLSKSAEGNNQDVTNKSYKNEGKEPGTNTTYSQVARLKVSGSEVTEIVTLNAAEGSRVNEDTSEIVRYKDLDKYTYTPSSFKLDGVTQFSVNSSTVVINVPADRSDKTNYAKRTLSSFSTNSDYWVEAFDVNENKVASLVIRYGVGDSTMNYMGKDSNHHLVGAQLTESYDEKDDAVSVKVPVYSAATTLKSWAVLASEASKFNELEVGDVIQFNYDNDNKIQGLAYVQKYSDIEEILDGAEVNGETYNWNEEYDEIKAANRYQTYKFDFRYPKGTSGAYETYSSSSMGTIPYSRAAMFNVMQIIPEDEKIYVTKSGFKDGEMDIDAVDYEEVKISSSTKILKMTDDGKEFTAFEDDGTTPLSIESFKDAKSYGEACSKIMVSTIKETVKLIVIYE